MFFEQMVFEDNAECSIIENEPANRMIIIFITVGNNENVIIKFKGEDLQVMDSEKNTKLDLISHMS